MKRLEAAALIAGALLVVLALAAYDWRLGLASAGLVIAGSSLDIPRRRP